MTDTDLKAELITVRDFLASHKWGQGLSGLRPKSTYCIMQAAERALSAEGYLAVAKALDKAAEREGTPRPFASVTYNDEPGRTKDEMLALIDSAIESA